MQLPFSCRKQVIALISITMDMELISRETIKPFPPTPSHLKLYTLSFIDAIVFRAYVPVVFFYNPNQDCDQASRILLLKKSLSKVLSKYYHFAGSLRDQFSVDCNDQGVSFLVTRIKGKLSEILFNPTEESMKPLYPDELAWKESSSESIVVIQVNCFECGGMAISVCMCHKIIDAATLINFMNDWATMAKMQSEEAELPFPPVLDIGPSVFPQGEMPVFPEILFTRDKNVCKRLVLEGSKIDSLKAMVSSQNVNNPTRAEVVTALVYKCLVSALGLSFNNTCFRVMVNLRKRMVPPLPEKSVGNLFWWYMVFNPFVEGRDTELHDLVSKIKQGLSEFCDTIPKNFGGKDRDLLFISECLKQATSTSVPSDMENQTFFITSSWCGFRIYETNFGWGKPIWISNVACPMRNTIFLMDTRDGRGVEVHVTLQEKDMALFEHDAELLPYAILNPTIDLE